MNQPAMRAVVLYRREAYGKLAVPGKIWRLDGCGRDTIKPGEAVDRPDRAADRGRLCQKSKTKWQVVLDKANGGREADSPATSPAPVGQDGVGVGRRLRDCPGAGETVGFTS